MKKIAVGMLAHVDGGKTTLSESLLYVAGKIRKMGRVDHRDTFFDTFSQERERGITIFSKQAELDFSRMNFHMTLVDTPGHVDFAAETERVFEILDYGILIVSGNEGVQSHTLTLASLLDTYRVPFFIFVNKMDLPGTDREKIMKSILSDFGDRCVDMTDVDLSGSKYADEKNAGDDVLEAMAMTSEKLMEEYLENRRISVSSLTEAVGERKLVPCFFGSALKGQGTGRLVEGIAYLTEEKTYSDEKSAKVYKISEDKKGKRLTFVKVTGGSLRIKDTVATDGTEEKIHEIRIYSGEGYRNVDQVSAGELAALAGPELTYAGQGLFLDEERREAVIRPMLRYQVTFGSDVRISELLAVLKKLEEELPEMKVEYSEETSEVSVQLMGPVQQEVIAEIVKERSGIHIGFSRGRIVYKETVGGISAGTGHFEPLRHYAEVSLMLQPAPAGSGIIFESDVPEDVLSLNWQNLIRHHIYEKDHRGVLAGCCLTDIRITLVHGRSHPKHTVGGDFREATCRALQNALMKNTPVLLEPWYSFRLEVPEEALGRAMSDITQMGGMFDPPEYENGMQVLKGMCPVYEMMEYAEEIGGYTGGRGRIMLSDGGYRPCHNTEEVLAGGDIVSYREDTPDSVFCSGGSGFIVPWDEVENHVSPQTMSFIRNAMKRFSGEKDESGSEMHKKPDSRTGVDEDDRSSLDLELKEIFERTYGPVKERKHIPAAVNRPSAEHISIEKQIIKDRFLIVDGYNMIFAWPELKELAGKNLDSARESLIHILKNYQGYTGCRLAVIFDAYKVKGNHGHIEKDDNIEIVFTGEGETADGYIEKMTKEAGRKSYVEVATSDNLERQIITGHGAHIMSAAEFHKEVERIDGMIKSHLERQSTETYRNTRRTVGDSLSEKLKTEEQN